MLHVDDQGLEPMLLSQEKTLVSPPAGRAVQKCWYWEICFVASNTVALLVTTACTKDCIVPKYALLEKDTVNPTIEPLVDPTIDTIDEDVGILKFPVVR